MTKLDQPNTSIFLKTVDFPSFAIGHIHFCILYNFWVLICVVFFPALPPQGSHIGMIDLISCVYLYRFLNTSQPYAEYLGHVKPVFGILEHFLV